MNVRAESQFLASGVASALEAVFSKRGWLSEARPDLRARVIAMAHPVCFARGARLFAQGDGPGGVFGVVSGGIALESSARGHPMRIGHIARSGVWVGEGPTITGARRILGLLATEDSQLIHVSLATLQNAARSDVELTALLATMAHLGTQMATWVACDLLIPDAPRRIGAVLLRVTAAEDGVAPTHPNGFLLDQSLIGELANVSRAHVNRVLSLFEAKGWIAKRYNHLRILNPKAVAEFAYSED